MLFSQSLKLVKYKKKCYEYEALYLLLKYSNGTINSTVFYFVVCPLFLSSLHWNIFILQLVLLLLLLLLTADRPLYVFYIVNKIWEKK